jgi:hypothetical protein
MDQKEREMEQTSVTEKQKYWLGHIEKAKIEGLSSSSYCKREGLNVTHMHYYANWFRKRREKTSSFVEVKIREQVPETPVMIRIGKQITMEIPADPAFIVELLRGIG